MAENIISARVAWKLKKAIVGRPAKGTSNTGTASFVRTDENGVGWVRLPGADTDTPINGNLVTDMKPGDIVSYRIDGDRLSVMGNVTSPSVGRSVVRAITEEVQEPLRVEVSKARAENASTLKVATEAQTVANATGQHFWEDESGIHVTEATQADWNDTSSPSYHSGPNILINSLGQLLRNGINNLVSITASAVAFYDGLGNAAANVVAQFGSDGAQIGRTGESHQWLDYHSMQMIDKEGNTYFHVSDLRGMDGTAEMVDVFTGDGTTRTFRMGLTATNTTYTVSVSDSSGGAVTKTKSYVTFATSPTRGSTITITYTTASSYAKAYTLGVRGSGNVGSYSVAEGFGCVAGGTYSHAEGDASSAVGQFAHAEGNSTSAQGPSSHAEGANTAARGPYSHAEGDLTFANGRCSHTEGSSTTAAGDYSHTQNLGNSAAYEAQTAIGKYNANDPNNAFEIGNGTNSERSNALAVDWNGNLTTGNFRDAAMTKDLSNSGIVRACRIGNMLVMSGSLSECSVSSTFTWTHLAHIDPTELGITSVGALGAMVDVNGGGPSYYGSTNGGGFAHIVDGVLYADMQTNAAFSNKFVKFLITAYVE